ncbi:MAG: hypothetical protein QGI05_01845, partial [Candidatus Omnitrophota bacterium]|nr:hypothetical protein [Candidatus Omnitrophota bacterium]
DVVDMECSAFFSASRAVNKKAAALFYVTDIINKVPFYNLGFGEKLSISSSIKTALEFLWKAIEKNSTS